MNANQEKIQERRYTVSFYDGDTLLSRTNVLENKRVEVPKAPAKEGYEFMGWYKDSSKTRGFYYYEPITADTNIYAKYLTYKEVFLEARENTARANQFKYDYQLDFRILTKHLHPSAYYRGTVQYNEHSRDVKYYKDEIIGGGLKIDMHNYSVLHAGDNKLYKLKYKYIGSLHPIGEEATDGYDGSYVGYDVKRNFKKSYEYSTFAKSIFEDKDNDVDTVKKIGYSTYELTFTKTSLEKAVEFLGTIGMQIISRKLKEYGISAFKSVTIRVALDDSKTRIETLDYSMEFGLNFKYQISLERDRDEDGISPRFRLKGNVTLKMDYKMQFDHSFDGKVRVAQKVRDSFV